MRKWTKSILAPYESENDLLNKDLKRRKPITGREKKKVITPEKPVLLSCPIETEKVNMKKKTKVLFRLYAGIIVIILALAVLINALSFMDIMSMLFLHGMLLVLLFYMAGMLIGPLYIAWKKKNELQKAKSKRKTVSFSEKS